MARYAEGTARERSRPPRCTDRQTAGVGPVGRTDPGHGSPKHRSARSPSDPRLITLSAAVMHRFAHDEETAVRSPHSPNHAAWARWPLVIPRPPEASTGPREPDTRPSVRPGV